MPPAHRGREEEIEEEVQDQSGEEEEEEEYTGDEHATPSKAKRSKKETEKVKKLHAIYPWNEEPTDIASTEEVLKGIPAEILVACMKYYNKKFATQDCPAPQRMNAFGEGLIEYFDQSKTPPNEKNFYICLVRLVKIISDKGGNSNKNAMLCFAPIGVTRENKLELPRGIVVQENGSKETEQKNIKPMALCAWDPNVFQMAKFIQFLHTKVLGGTASSEDFNPLVEFMGVMKPGRAAYNENTLDIGLGSFSIRYRATELTFFVVLATNNPKSWLDSMCTRGAIQLIHNDVLSTTDSLKMSEKATEAINSLIESSSRQKIVHTKGKQVREVRSRKEASKGAGPVKESEILDVNDKHEGTFMSLSRMVTKDLLEAHPMPAGANKDMEIKYLASVEHRFDTHPMTAHARGLTEAQINEVAKGLENLLSLLLSTWTESISLWEVVDPLYKGQDALLKIEGLSTEEQQTLETPEVQTNLAKIRSHIKEVANMLVSNASTFVGVCLTITEVIMRRAVIKLMIRRYSNIHLAICNALEIIDGNIKQKIDVQFVNSWLYSMSYVLIFDMQDFVRTMNTFDLPPFARRVTTAPYIPLATPNRIKAKTDAKGDNIIPKFVKMDGNVYGQLKQILHRLSLAIHETVKMDTIMYVDKEKQKCIPEHMVFWAAVPYVPDSGDFDLHDKKLTTAVIQAGGWERHLFSVEHAPGEITYRKSHLDPHGEIIMKALEDVLDELFTLARRNPPRPNPDILWGPKTQAKFWETTKKYILDIAYTARIMVLKPVLESYLQNMPKDVRDLLCDKDNGIGRFTWPDDWEDDKQKDPFMAEFNSFMLCLGVCESILARWPSNICKDSTFRAFLFLATLPAYRLDMEARMVYMTQIPVFETNVTEKGLVVKPNPRYWHLGIHLELQTEDEKPCEVSEEEANESLRLFQLLPLGKE